MSLRNRLLFMSLPVSVVAIICIFFIVRTSATNSISKIQNSNTCNLLDVAMISIENQYNSLSFHREYSLKIRKEERHNIVDITKSIIQECYDEYTAGKLGLEAAKNKALNKINNIRYNNGMGYIWINDMKKPVPRMLVHPIFPELNGKILSDTIFNTANDSINLFRAAADLCEKNGGGYIEYMWPKPMGALKLDEQAKTSYVELFEPWEWIIGTGVYFEDIEEDVQNRLIAIRKELKQTLGNIPIAESGYFHIFNSNKEILLHPLRFGEAIDSINTLIVENEIMTKIVEVRSQQSSTQGIFADDNAIVLDDKKVFVKYFEPLDWYVCASIYTGEIEKPGRMLGRHILLISFIFILFSTIISISLANSIAKPIKKLSRAVSKFSTVNSDIVPSQIPVSGSHETRGLASVIKKMLESINSQTDKLVKAKARAEESDMLKSSFLANMSHEIRTPLNAIVGLSTLLGNEVRPAKREEFVTAISDSSDDLLTLIDDIIDISRIESNNLKINKKEFDVNTVLLGMNDMLESLIIRSRKNEVVNLKLVIEDGVQIINSDPDRIKQVFTNLLSNSIKFTETGEIEYGYITSVNDNNQKEIQFYVRDTGIGIPNNIQKSIFDRFMTFGDSKRRVFRGTGLGLAISKSLVELLGGNIYLESQEHKGTTISFNIPIGQLENRKPKVKSGIDINKINQGYNWQGKKILVAEDDQFNYMFMQELLLQTKVDFKRVINGQEAIDVFALEDFDLILMDIRMPVLDGYEAIKKIRDMDPNIPIVAITAYGMAEDEIKSKEVGCNEYLSKPFKPAIFFSLADSYLNN